MTHGCGLDVADRRCAANTPGNPVHIQFAFPAHGISSTQSTTIGSAHRAAGRLHGFGGVFISEPDAYSIRFLLRIIRSAVRLLQSTCSRAGSVDGLLMCGVRPLWRAAQQGTCRLALHEFLVRGDWLHQSPRHKPGRNSSQQPLAAGHGPAPRDPGEHSPHITHRPGTIPGKQIAHLRSAAVSCQGDLVRECFIGLACRKWKYE